MAPTALPLPVDAEFEAVLDGYVIAGSIPRWTPAGTEQPGALLAWSRRRAARPRCRTVRGLPAQRNAGVEPVAASESKLWVKVLDDVSGKLIELTRTPPAGPNARWTCLPTARSRLPRPAARTFPPSSRSSMLTPPTLYAVPARRAAGVASEAHPVRRKQVRRAEIRHLEGRHQGPYTSSIEGAEGRCPR